MSANYPHIVSKVMRGIWVITDAKFQAIESVLASRLAGEFTDRESHIRGVKFVGPLKEDEDTQTEPEVVGRTVRIPVYGIIGKHCSYMEMSSGGCDLDQVNDALDVADNDSSIDKLVLDFRSPGGTVTGIPETARKIDGIAGRKEVVAFSDSECCSGALWLASMATKFYITESAEIGSVGVYLALLDKTRMLDDMGVKVNAIHSGKFKLSGAPFKRLTSEEEAMFQRDVDKIGSLFRAAVTLNRTVPPEFMEGQVYMGQAAVDAGFCDGLVDDINDLF